MLKKKTTIDDFSE